MVTKKEAPLAVNVPPTVEHGSMNRELAREHHTKRLELAERLLMPKVLNGDVGARRSVLSFVAEAVSECGYFPPQVSAFVARGLEEIAEDRGDLKARFGISRGRGEKRQHLVNAVSARQFRQAYQVECFRICDQVTVEAAIAKVAESEGFAEDTVRRAWTKNHKEARREVDLQLEHFGRVMRIS